MLVLGLLMLGLGVLLLSNLGASVTMLRWLVVVFLVLAAVDAFGTAALRWVDRLAGWRMSRELRSSSSGNHPGASRCAP